MHWLIQKIKPNTLTLIVVMILLLGAAILYLRPWWKIGGDGFGYYMYARSMVFDQDVDFTNELTFFDTEFNARTLKYWQTPIEKAGNPFAIGPSLLWLPFVTGARAVQDLFHFSDSFPIPGYNAPFQIGLAIGTWFYALLGAVLLYNGLKQFFLAWPAWCATLAIFCVTALPYYLVYEPSMAHGMTFFTTSLLFFLATNVIKHEHINWHWSLYIGGAIGLALLVRWQDVLFGIIPLGILIWKTRNAQWYKHALLIAGSAFVVAIPQLVMWKHLYGSYISIPQTSSFFDFAHPHFFEFLFSGYHGLFIIHPLLVISIGGMLYAWSKNKLFVSLLIIGLAAQVWLNASLTDWFGGGSFGSRRMISASFIFAFGYAYFFSLLNQRRRLIGVVALIFCVGAIFNVLLAVSYARNIIPLNAPTSISDVYTVPVQLIKDTIKF